MISGDLGSVSGTATLLLGQFICLFEFLPISPAARCGGHVNFLLQAFIIKYCIMYAGFVPCLLLSYATGRHHYNVACIISRSKMRIKCSAAWN